MQGKLKEKLAVAVVCGLVVAWLTGSVGAQQPVKSIHPYPPFPFDGVPGRPGFGTKDAPERLQEWEAAWRDAQAAPVEKREEAAKRAAEILGRLQVGTRLDLYNAAAKANEREKAAQILGSVHSESFFWGYPEFLPYPGSIEHVRHESQRYLPPYPQYNHNTLVKNFILKDHAQARGLCADMSEPVYWHTQYNRRVPVEEKRGPFRVYPWRPGTSLDIEIGRLEPKLMYAVRVIGALSPEDYAAPPRKQLVFEFQVNDKPDGSTSTYVLRGCACDNFYEVVNFLFPALDNRVYRGRLTLLPESDAALYTYNIDAHDIFGECAKRAGKSKTTLSEPGPRPAPITDAGRAQRDSDLWYSLPPINVHYDDRSGRKASGGFDFAPYGRQWDRPFQITRGAGRGPEPEAVYTWQDLASQKPLPGVGDRGYGVQVAEDGAVHSFIAFAAFNRYHDAGGRIQALVRSYQGGDQKAGRDAAFLLGRFVYQLPAVKPTNYLTYIRSGSPDRPPRRYGPGSDIPGGWESAAPDRLLNYYDQLFNYIHDNQELAAALGRYIPWIKTPDDVRFLFDVYLVQYCANEMLHYRFYYDHGLAQMVITAAVIQDDIRIGEPWMQFVFTRGWEYPQALAGLADNIVTSTTRDGVDNIGSVSYAGPVGLQAAQLTEAYIRNGGLKKYDLSDLREFAKNAAGATFRREIGVAGGHNIGIGDVGGPSTPFGAMCVPDLSQRSRVLAAWAGILEGGTQQDDFRFRRAAAVTLAVGVGHAHDDTLDLRVFAHGSIMSGDFNQRPEYGRPRHQRSYAHNVVEVDGNGEAFNNSGDWAGYAWVRNLFDPANGGTPYLLAESTPPDNHRNVQLFRRHVAILDVDEGSAAQKKPVTSDPNVVTPSSYFFDVFRVSGGRKHTYCFHGCCDDDFEVNVKNKTFLEENGQSEDEKYMQSFRYERYYRDTIPTVTEARWAPQQPFIPDRDRQWAADADGDVLQATWRLDRKGEERMLGGGKGAVTEPRKYTRLHLFDQANARILQGIAVDVTDAAASCLTRRHTSGRCLYAQKRFEKDADSVFVALIEPYAGEPFIRERRLVDIPGNEADALRAAAVEVKTTNGHTDLCFADGRPERIRQLPGGVRVAAEFAYLSRDEKGIRQATITGGTLLDAGDLTLRLRQREHRGKITAVDFLERQMVVEGFPAVKELENLSFEVGNKDHLTSFQIDRISKGPDGKTILHCPKGLEMMRARVLEADYARGRLKTNIAMIVRRGCDAGLVATGEDLARRWRVAYEGGNRHEGHWFRLEGAPITEKDFPIAGRLSVWEFGEGDEVSLRAGASIRRTDEQDVWEAYANVPFSVAIRNAKLEWSSDRAAWTAVADGAELGPGAGTPIRFWLRVKR